jgi:hypothetical protein
MHTMDEQSTEKSLETEGSLLSEEDIKEMGQSEEIDYPMEGEPATEEEHSHSMPAGDIQVIGEDGHRQL